jgi:hypothetical protein
VPASRTHSRPLIVSTSKAVAFWREAQRPSRCVVWSIVG